MQVVNLGGCRELLRAWDRVRTEILKGDYEGWTLCMKRWDGEATVFYTGDGADSKQAAAKAVLQLSWEITQQTDFEASRM